MVGDRISSLHDSVLCNILCFLPTKAAVATCVLSKRWYPLCRSLPTLDFHCGGGHVHLRKTNSAFVNTVNTFLQNRDLKQHSLRRFRLKCCSSFCYPTKIHVFQLVAAAAAENTLEHLDLAFHDKLIVLPSAVLSYKSLVVFKLQGLLIESFPYVNVNLPLLKILSITRITISEYRLLGDLLSGSPNLQELLLRYVYFKSYAVEAKFIKLPKLVRADIGEFLKLYFNLHGNVFARIEFHGKLFPMFSSCASLNTVEYTKDLFPEFYNLTNVEFDYRTYDKSWMEVLKVLMHCPKVQNLAIFQCSDPLTAYDDSRGYWQYPPCVPKCISLHLKTCLLRHYCGFNPEFEFAEYILQNASLLEDMTVWSCQWMTGKPEELEMRKKLSSVSSTCQLTFE